MVQASCLKINTHLFIFYWCCIKKQSEGKGQKKDLHIVVIATSKLNLKEQHCQHLTMPDKYLC